jgi:inorganic pyrophosphatase
MKRYLGSQVHVIIDRPKGSQHPSYHFRYPINYGYIPDTMAADGEEIDAYVLGPDEPIKSFDGICIAIIHRYDDNEDKLVVSSPDSDLTANEILEAVDFQERYFRTELILA